MLDKEDLKFQDKLYTAHKKNRDENTEKIVKKLDELKPEKPDKKARKHQEARDAFFDSLTGEDGYTPVKGQDYFTDEEAQEFLNKATPVKGVHYNDGEAGKDGKNGKDGYTPQKGIDYQDGEKGEKGEDGLKGEKGEAGKDGSPDTPDQIKEKLSTLKGKERLHIKNIHGFDEVLNEAGSNFLDQAKGFAPRALNSLYDVNIYGLSDGQTLVWKASQQKWIPGTASGGGGLTPIVISGAVNGSNLTFTSTTKPTYIVSDGVWYTALDANSNVQWSYAGGTITLSIAPPNYSITGF